MGPYNIFLGVLLLGDMEFSSFCYSRHTLIFDVSVIKWDNCFCLHREIIAKQICVNKGTLLILLNKISGPGEDQVEWETPFPSAYGILAL